MRDMIHFSSDRCAAALEETIAEFERSAEDLDACIGAEESRTGLRDPNHFAYPLVAKAARGRRDNLRASAQDLRKALSACGERG